MVAQTALGSEYVHIYALFGKTCIHSVKGLEFPAVCVVLTAKTAGGILDVLNGTVADADTVEEARKIYVAASRAERLLAIATPKSRATTLKKLLDVGGHSAEVVVI